MTDENKTKAQLVTELKELREQVLDLKNKKPFHIETDEKRFKELAELLPEAMFETDANLNVTTVNKRALELFGYSNADVTKGLNAIKMIVPKDRNRVKQNLNKRLKGEAPGIVEYQALKKDSSTFPVFLRINPIKQEGELAGFRGLVVDISETKTIEDKLRQRESFLNSLIDQNPYPMWISDDKGTLIQINQACCDLLNIRPDEVVGKYNVLQDNIVKKQGFTLLVKSVYSKGEIVNFTIHYDSSTLQHLALENTASVILDVSISPVKDDNGKVTNAIIIHNDITARKQVEEELYSSENLLHRIAENYPNSYLSIIEKDLTVGFTAGQEFQKQNINPDDYIGLTLEQVFGDQAPIVREYYQNTFAGEEQNFELFINDQYQLYKTVPLQNKNGGIDHILSVVENITERKLTESTLKQSEERYRELVNTLNSGVAIYKVINDGKSGSDYIIQDFNKFSLQHEKLKKKDVIGKSLKDIRPNIDEYGLIDIFRKVWQTGEPAFYPAKIYADEKYANYYENRVFRLPNAEILAVYDDVTEQQTAVEKNRESKERFERAMEATRDGLYDWNLITNEIYYSPGWKRMLGYEYDELPNDFSIWETLTDPEDAKRSWKMQQELVNKKRDRFEIEFKMKHKDGYWVEILSRAFAVFDKNDKAIRIVGTHVNITERKLAETLLKENETLLNEVGKIAKIGGWEMDLISRTAKWTKGSYDIVEINYDDPIPGPDEHLGYYLPEFRPIVENAMTALIQNDVPLKFDAKLLTAKGNIKWCRAIGQAIRENGKCVKISGTFQDISQEKYSEEKLRDSERRLSIVFNNTTDLQLLVRLDDDGEFRINAVNNAYIEAARSFGINISVENLVGKTLPEAVQVLGFGFDVLEYTMKNYKKAVATGKPVEYSETIDLKEGTYFAEITLNPVADSSGNCKFVLYNSHNITEQRLAEISKRESEMKYRTLVETLPQRIFSKDRELRFLTCNKNFAKDLNTTPEKLIGKTDEDFYPKALADKFQQDDRRVMETGQIEDFEETSILKEKERIVHTVKTPLRDQQGQIVGILGIFWDITEKKKMEIELRLHRDELEKLVKERTAELEEKNIQLERFNKLFVGREFRVKELKEQIKDLENRLNK
jgi:PAS domain S-box-containing protein